MNKVSSILNTARVFYPRLSILPCLLDLRTLPRLPCANLLLRAGGAKAIAQGQGNAYAAGNAQEHSLKSKERIGGQEASQAKKIEGKKQVDHLGLEG